MHTPIMHVPHHACPLPCTPTCHECPCQSCHPALHATLPCMSPAMHTLPTPTMHTCPLPCTPPRGQNNRHLWKHNLSATTVADGNKCQAWLSALQGQHNQRDAEGSGEYADQYMDPTMEDPLDYCEFLVDLISELNVELINLVLFLSFSVLWTWIWQID